VITRLRKMRVPVQRKSALKPMGTGYTTPAARAYTRAMVGVIVLIVLALGVGALIWWGSFLPPTRPRPDSRYRGRTFTSVDRKLKRKPRR